MRLGRPRSLLREELPVNLSLQYYPTEYMKLYV